MGCATAATENGFSRAGLTLLLPRIGTFASLHVCAIFTFPLLIILFMVATDPEKSTYCLILEMHIPHDHHR
jgi:hypothetical protein